MSDDGGSPPVPSGAEAAPRPKRRKRRRKPDDGAPVPNRARERADPSPAREQGDPGAEAGDAGTATGEDAIPAFARGWPRDEALDALVDAFEAGDYARVRREAPALAQRTESDAVRRAARELRRRLDPDPLAVYMLMAAGALLVFLAGWYWLHPHSP